MSKNRNKNNKNRDKNRDTKKELSNCIHTEESNTVSECEGKTDPNEQDSGSSLNMNEISALADAAGIIVGSEKDTETDKDAENDIGKNKKDKKQKRINIAELDDHVKELIDEALDESADELGLTDDQPAQSANFNIGQILNAVFGAIILIFAVIGIVSVGLRIHDYRAAKRSNIEKIQYFERLILPLCASDAPTFESTESLNSDVIISAACWDVILSPSTSYPVENGSYTISYLDLEARINKLFGKGTAYIHSSVGDEELMFEYDEEKGMYRIPALPRTMSYIPSIDHIEATDNGYLLTVSYKIPVTSWIFGSTTVEKIMTYSVSGNGLNYTIASLKVEEIVNGYGL